MTDKLLGIVSISLFIAFSGIVVVYVKEPALSIVVVVVWLMVAYDFWRELFAKPTSDNQ